MTATKAKLKPQQPGQPVPEKQQPPQAEQKKEAVEQKPAEQVFSDEEKLLIEAEVQRRIRAEKQAANPNEPDLPSQSEIDSTKIDRAVLCREGWVTPTPEELKR